jgi:hypothetical protein
VRLARWLLPAVSLGLVSWFVVWTLGGSRPGPGALHPVHARAPALAGGANCEACHVPGQGIDADGCASCHAPIGVQLARGRGLHGSLPQGRRERCELCHSEHHGGQAPLIAAYAFLRAGVAEASHYDHRHVDFGLRGAHARLACGECHAAANAPEPPAGGRFLGLVQRCDACHDDAHRGTFGADCQRCHGQERPWREVPLFRHEALPLRGAHAAVACAACHIPGSPRAVASLPVPALPVRTCADCHADPHSGPARRAMPLAASADCARCHEPTQWGAARPTAEQHAARGFDLRGAHARVECAECHGDAQRGPLWSDEPPPVSACAVCHQHPHRAEVVAVAVAEGGAANGCAGCHTDADERFDQGRIDARGHDATGFPLAPPHAGVECAACHTGATWQQRFPGREPSACSACHADVHRGQSAAEPRYAQCTACHLPTSFHPVQFGAELHAHTSFPLAGAHGAVACTRCHAGVVDGMRRFAGTGHACSACHADPHGGAVERAGLPAAVAGREGCARCHDTNAFAPVTAAFDHARWTGHELRGAHSRLDCTQCHPRSPRTDGRSTRLGPAAGTSCADCHADPHAGQFAEGGAVDCARCHVAEAFVPTTFDHATARLPLDATHAALPCSRCHLPVETGLGDVVRYRPLGTGCGDCHRPGGVR